MPVWQNAAFDSVERIITANPRSMPIGNGNLHD
jgi:hypothetical protein